MIIRFNITFSIFNKNFMLFIFRYIRFLKYNKIILKITSSSFKIYNLFQEYLPPIHSFII